MPQPNTKQAVKSVGKRLVDLAFLLFGLTTLLFFLLRATGDPAVAMAGLDADPQTLADIRAQYGFDAPLWVQYVRYLGQLLTGDFGTSLASDRSALSIVLDALPATLWLTLFAVLLGVSIAFPVGAWLGAGPQRGPRKLAAIALYIVQGTPGFVVALLFIQIFAVGLGWLPAIGFGGPLSWILPACSLSLFIAPKLARVLAANVSVAMEAGYVRTARAYGFAEQDILRTQVLPNALLGAIALLGAQISFLIGGVVVIETIFAWPGIGRLLIQSTLALDFPVVQATAVMIAVLVFCVNAAADGLFVLADPRLRKPVSV